MAERGQITGGVLDGPLALDNAIDPAAAAIKKIGIARRWSRYRPRFPDLEAGNMLAKSLTFLAGADAAGIVLGACADHPDQPSQFGPLAPGLLRGSGPGRRRAAQTIRFFN